MKLDERPCEDEIRDSGHQQDHAVDGYRPGGNVILTDPGGREWNKGQPEQQV
jgi:hypothetical protein